MSFGFDPRSSLHRGDSDTQPFVLEGGYHHREGLAPNIEAKGSRRMYRPNSIYTWAFLLSAIAQACVVLAIESYLFANFQESLKPNKAATPLSKTIPTYLTLFIFGFLYQIVLVYDSLRLKNTIQVIGLCMYNVGMLIYAAIQYDQINRVVKKLIEVDYLDSATTVWTDIQPYLLVVPIVIAVFTVILSFIAWKLYDEFAWTIYKHISADLRMKRRFLNFQVYIALLKFDFFFFLGFTVQFLVIVTDLAPAEMGLTIAAVPITILILFMAAFWTRRENTIGMAFTIFLFFAGLAYFIFKLVRMYQPGKATSYLPVRKSLTSFAVITIVLIILTIANAIMCTMNFNKGLKPYIVRRKIGGEEAAEKDNRMTELPDLKHGNPVSTRMTID